MSTRCRSIVGLLAVAAVGALAACGVGVDDSPRALEVEASTTTVAATPSVGQVSSVLYYVREGTLMPLERNLSSNSAETSVEALGQPPPVLTRYGLSSSIPSGTELIGTARDGGRLVVNLSSAFDNVVGRQRQQAIGQMVMTVTEQRGVDSVEFQVEGQPITVSSPARGDQNDVGACDYQSLLASPEEVAQARLPVESLQATFERRDQLAEECEDLTE